MGYYNEPAVSKTERSSRVATLLSRRAPYLLLAILLLSPPLASGGFISPVVIDTIPVPASPAEAAVNSDTNRLYVTTGQGLDVINTLTDKEVALIPVGDGPQGVAVDAATNRVYVVNVRDQTVSVIDGNANRVIDTITGFDYRPRLIAINPITNMIYVGNHGNGAGTTLAVINGFTDSIVQNIPVGNGPHRCCSGPRHQPDLHSERHQQYSIGRQWFHKHCDCDGASGTSASEVSL